MNRSAAAIVLALALAVVLALAAVARADPPPARGVTAEIAAGAALVGDPGGIGFAPALGAGGLEGRLGIAAIDAFQYPGTGTLSLVLGYQTF